MTRLDLIEQLRNSPQGEMHVPEMRLCRVTEVIEVQFTRGLGVEGDPIRLVTAWYEKDGTPIAEKDPV